MQLQLGVIAFQSLHFDHTRFFQVIESQFFTLELIHVLHDLSQDVDDVNQVVPFIEHSVNLQTSVSELGGQTEFDHISHQVRMRSVTHFEDILFSDSSKASIGCLQIVKSISHITFSCENQSLETPMIMFNAFLLHYD